MSAPHSMRQVVLDTNWALDVLVFQDPRTHALQTALAHQQVRWLVCPAMRDELQRVLDYPLVAKHLHKTSRQAMDLLQRFDHLTHPVGAPAPCGLICRDPDDQVFIDLAIEHHALLLSKDKEVLKLASKARQQAADISQIFHLQME